MRTRLLVIAVLGACSSDGTAPPEPIDGIVHVRFATTGPDVDTDGYIILIDGNPGRSRVGANGTASMRLLAGQHRVLVGDVAPNCTVEPQSDYVMVIAGAEISYNVSGSCVALGTIQVSVVTTGVDIDPDGYRVVVSAVDFPNNSFASIRANETASVGRFAPGRYRLALEGLSANCGGFGFGPRDVNVVSDGSVSTEFAVTCSAAQWIAYTAVEAPTNTDIYVVRSNGAGGLRLTAHPAADDEPAWSPDGTQIAFTSNRDGPRSVYVMNDDGSGVTRLTPQSAHSYQPAWSPDGTRIAFVSERDVGAGIYVMDRDGSNQKRLTEPGTRGIDPAWSPDGTRIAFASDRSGSMRIYTMNADGSDIVRVTRSTAAEPETGPAWSNDGTRIAFSRQVCDRNWWFSCYPALFTIQPGGDEIEIGSGEDAAWSSDGRAVAVTRFACDFSYYAPTDNCTVTGIGIIGITDRGLGTFTTWEAEVTRGTHRRPTWHP